jgi:hypothetical protein
MLTRYAVSHENRSPVSYFKSGPSKYERSVKNVQRRDIHFDLYKWVYL